MRRPKIEMTEGGEKHFSVGAVLKNKGKYLLIERAIYPPGFACPAGHIDTGETPLKALKREVEEEAGLKIKNSKLLFNETLDSNECYMGVKIHEWHVYECEFDGEVDLSHAETKGGGWYTKAQIKKLKLEKVWQHWFKKMGVLK